MHGKYSYLYIQDLRPHILYMIPSTILEWQKERLSLYHKFWKLTAIHNTFILYTTVGLEGVVVWSIHPWYTHIGLGEDLIFSCLISSFENLKGVSTLKFNYTCKKYS